MRKVKVDSNDDIPLVRPSDYKTKFGRQKYLTRNRERKNLEAHESPGPVKESAFTQQQNCYKGRQ